MTVAGAQTLPSPWASRDIGSPALRGSATFSNGVFRIDAAGEDIWSTSDEFHFVYQAITGDVDVRARVDSVSAAHAWSKAGIMIRSSLSADAAHGYALVSAGKGVAFQRRQAIGVLSAHTSGTFVGPPEWVRLVRAGTRLTAMASPDGVTWTTIDSDTIALGATAYVGVAVTSHHAGMRTTSAVSNVSVTSSALPAGQTGADIGSPAIKGSTSFAAGTYTINAAGTDIWDAADQFHYVYQPVSGNVDVVARVRSISAADRWSKAGVMIRESLSAGSRHATALASSAKGYAFQRRPEPNAWSEHTDGGTGTAPGWVRLVRTGTLFEAYRSADGANWTRMGTASISMGDTVYVGIAVTSHNPNLATTVVVDSLRVTASTSTSNKPPAVLLSSPSNGSSLSAPATVTVAASASDPDGTVAAVEFYANSTLLGRDVTAPYGVTASGMGAGSYALKAIATDNQGAMTVSDQVTITVTISSTAEPPTGIAFQKSADHDTLVRKYVLEVRGTSTTPLVTTDLGKPTPSATGEIAVALSAFFQGLAPGSYTAKVLAVSDAASAGSTAVEFTR